MEETPTTPRGRLSPRQVKYLIIAVLGATLSAILLTGLIVLLRSPGCKLVSHLPAKKVVSNLAPHISEANDALVKIAGYIQVEREQTDGSRDNFLPIEVDKFSMHYVKNNTYRPELHMTSSCLNITLPLTKLNAVPDGYWLQSGNMVIDVRLNNGEELQCSTNEGVFSSTRGTYFSCLRQLLYNCKWSPDWPQRNKHILMLVLDSFQFEIEGDPKLVKEGKFTRSPYQC